MAGDLISFDEEVTSSPTSMPSTIHHTRSTHRDSFSELASMMKAKKSYIHTVPPASPPLPLTTSLNGPRPANHIASEGSISSPLARRPRLSDFFFEPISEHCQDILAQHQVKNGHEDIFHNSEASMWNIRKPSASRPYKEPFLIPEFELPARNGLTDPPSPPQSLTDSASAFRSEQEPIVRLTKPAYDKMCKSLEDTVKENKELHTSLAAHNRTIEQLRHGDHEMSSQLGKHRYQNEANKAQKSAMGRALGEKETTIQTQQLEIKELMSKISALNAKVEELEGMSEDETNYLRSVIESYRVKHEGADINIASLKSQHRYDLSNLAAIKDQELKSIKTDYQHALAELAATKNQHKHTLDDLSTTKDEFKNALIRLAATKDLELESVKEVHKYALEHASAAKDQEWGEFEQSHQRALSKLAASKDCELEEAQGIIRKLKLDVSELSQQILETPHAQVNSEAQRDCAHEQANGQAKQEKFIRDLRHQLMDERIKVVDLEDEIEVLREKTKQIDIDDLQAKLREKTSECDRHRSHAKTAEARLKHSQERLLHITSNGLSLQGAVHLVKPHADSKLPRTVHSCTECYGKNMECDDNTTCRNCADSNTRCLRWRCSLKHKLGDCPFTPCKFPHDSQGWLMLPQDRPQW
ncbi:hypothetical protein PTNB73_05191 [Pyrenophora teres f. teres]|nr:hypothetical protein HRS9139_05239 [Pyrenophora teres f. teres]KAE8840811.1 hypothetical protein PTNB85_04210 [Pyrenophora teres f. teres]KAE8849051.1 hypothetical protein HRS9122_03067 [Pyrenophora teres f. teres]KAE8864307.1 hypothetical protein PTNB29_04271 [Pyrenophora teres f. teres]KAE8867097.1 hypothetical protein PTNB73_05191 [Pyrenophora teres f. teres]